MQAQPASSSQGHEATISRQRIVAGEQQGRFGLGLCDQHAVERIAMQAGQGSCHDCVQAGDPEIFEPRGFQGFQDLAWIAVEPPNRMLDADLPDRRCADKDLIVVDKFALARRKLLRIEQCPEEHVRIDDHTHLLGRERFEYPLWEGGIEVVWNGEHASQ